MKFTLLNYKINIRKINKPNSLGVLSLCADGQHVVLLDFDVPHSYDWIEGLKEQTKLIQEDYDLGDFEVYETAGGYHLICYTKVSLKEYKNLMDELPLLDRGFMVQATLRPERATTLRFYSLNKNKYSKYITTFKSKYGYEMPESNAHKQLFNHLKGLPVLNTGEPLPVSIEAAATVTFAAIKKGFVDNPKSRRATGRVFVADIGITPAAQ